MTAKQESSVIAAIMPKLVSEVSTAAVSGRAKALANSAAGPSNILKVTKAPTATKATSLTTDSTATASIRPCWCSVASMWRVPNSTAKAASESATNSGGSPSIGCTGPAPVSSGTTMAPSEDEIALSCSAM